MILLPAHHLAETGDEIDSFSEWTLTLTLGKSDTAALPPAAPTDYEGDGSWAAASSTTAASSITTQATSSISPPPTTTTGPDMMSQAYVDFTNALGASEWYCNASDGEFLIGQCNRNARPVRLTVVVLAKKLSHHVSVTCFSSLVIRRGSIFV